jgi:hypothetical protein
MASGPQPAPDVLVADQQWAARTRLVVRPVRTGQERSVRNAHGRQIENRPEVKRESGTKRVIAPGGVDQENVWNLRQGPDCGLQQRSLAQGEETRLVRIPGFAADRGVAHDA